MKTSEIFHAMPVEARPGSAPADPLPSCPHLFRASTFAAYTNGIDFRLMERSRPISSPRTPIRGPASVLAAVSAIELALHRLRRWRESGSRIGSGMTTWAPARGPERRWGRSGVTESEGTRDAARPRSLRMPLPLISFWRGSVGGKSVGELCLTPMCGPVPCLRPLAAGGPSPGPGSRGAIRRSSAGCRY